MSGTLSLSTSRKHCTGGPEVRLNLGRHWMNESTGSLGTIQSEMYTLHCMCTEHTSSPLDHYWSRNMPVVLEYFQYIYENWQTLKRVAAP